MRDEYCGRAPELDVLRNEVELVADSRSGRLAVLPKS
jgi:hypothetical protein